MAYLLLATSVFLAQALLFVPIVPVLMAAGVLAGQGRLRPGGAILALVAGLVVGDFFWYALGRLGGGRVLRRVCRISVEPDTCVRRTENVFGRFGARALIVTKFIPGLSTVVLPMAGVFGMQARRFVLYDAIGAVLWSTAYFFVGYLSARQLAELMARMRRPDRGTVLAIAAAAAAAYFAWKYFRRLRVWRAHRVERIHPEELRRRLAAHDDVVVFDVRHPVEFETDPFTIPGAVYVPAEVLELRPIDVPRDVEVVIYCTCPNEVTSAHQALRLRARGISRARPLEGGFLAWRALGFPVEFRGPVIAPEKWTLNTA